MSAANTMNASGRRAFDDAVRPLLQPIHAYLHRRVEQAGDADDCLSEVLLVLWKRGDLLPTGDDLRLYSYSVARNVLRNHQRATRRRQRLQLALDAEHVTRIQGTETTSMGLPEALSKLKDRDRELILLMAWDGLSSIEAGAVLGLSAGTTRVRYSRARTRLRTLLDQGDTA